MVLNAVSVVIFHIIRSMAEVGAPRVPRSPEECLIARKGGREGGVYA